MLGFEELAKKLDRLYSDRYGDRERAIREYGTMHEPDLRRLMESGQSLTQLVDAAKIGDSEHWAGFIREGMGIAVYVREDAHS